MIKKEAELKRKRTSDDELVKKTKFFSKEEEVSLFKKTKTIRQFSDKSDIANEFVTNSEAVESKRDNVKVACELAIQLYLEPVNVMSHVLYWLSKYSNYKKPEKFWFNDYIRNLIKYPVQLSFTSSRGIPHVHHTLPKYTLLMKFAGGDLHKVMTEFYVANEREMILECFNYITTPENACFRAKNTFGLRGEIEISEFLYDRVLSFFYEPSFYIITSYLIYVNYMLSSLTCGRDPSDYTKQLMIIRAPLVDYDIEYVGALNKNNSNYESKVHDFKTDLFRLNEILKLDDHKAMKDELHLLFSQKATFVCQEMDIRYNHIYSQLYSQ
jgi:hypothetical protein